VFAEPKVRRRSILNRRGYAPAGDAGHVPPEPSGGGWCGRGGGCEVTHYPDSQEQFAEKYLTLPYIIHYIIRHEY